jgi:Uma2 family endonuclease
MSRATLPTTRFTVDEVERLCEAAVFGARRVELLNGRIYRMAPQRSPHMAAVSKTAEALLRHCPSHEWIVIQGTLRIDRFNAPDPDLMWLAVPKGSPEHVWPLPLVLIEISDTTYRHDSGVKLRRYAQAGIQDYWIANLKAGRVEVYRDPQSPTGRPRDFRYASVAYFVRGQSISLAQRPQVSVAVDDLLP